MARVAKGGEEGVARVVKGGEEGVARVAKGGSKEVTYHSRNLLIDMALVPWRASGGCVWKMYLPRGIKKKRGEEGIPPVAKGSGKEEGMPRVAKGVWRGWWVRGSYSSPA